MKRISVEVEKTVKVKESRWVTADGTMFDEFKSACEYENGYREGIITRLGMKRIYCTLVFDKNGVSDVNFDEQFIWLPKSKDDIYEFYTTFMGEGQFCWGSELELDTQRKVIISHSEDDHYGLDFYDDICDYAIEHVKHLEEIGAMV